MPQDTVSNTEHSETPRIMVCDNLLPPSDQGALWTLLRGPGWSYGAYSGEGPSASRYWYKHFAGVFADGEGKDFGGIEGELSAYPLISALWRRLKATHLAGHTLTRCYANGYPSGAEGGVHLDALEANHFTAIYYPHGSWSADFAGETVFFNADRTDIIASVYPKPNRLVIFNGNIPHAARAISRSCVELRITLMFKTFI